MATESIITALLRSIHFAQEESMADGRTFPTTLV
jgi:hypothetical protein